MMEPATKLRGKSSELRTMSPSILSGRGVSSYHGPATGGKGSRLPELVWIHMPQRCPTGEPNTLNKELTSLLAV
jgi:hypothetical protein